MDVSNPLRAIAPGVEGDVLAALVRTHAPLTGARAARLADRSETQVREVMRRLEAQGLVRSERHGNSSIYVLNREHLLAEAVGLLASAADRAEGAIRELVAGWAAQPAAVALFGSFARRDGGPDSDVDILLVRPDPIDEDNDVWVAQRHALSRQVEAWTGNHVQILELSEAELHEARRRDEPLVESLRTDGVVLVGGLALATSNAGSSPR